MRSWLLAALAFVLLGSAHAAGQTNPPAPPGADVPEGQKAPPEIAPPKNDDKSLSDRLSRDKGVIKPPPSATPDMNVEPPVPEPNTTPVIPPPGSPGGDKDVIPK